MVTIKILIVLYNKQIEESETCTSLQKCDFLKKGQHQIYIWNNSKNPFSDNSKDKFRRYFEYSMVSFLGDGINHPLSEVYNKIIGSIDSEGFLFLFDHDSVVTNSYFVECEKAILNNDNINLFLPKIYYNDILVSPAHSYYFLGKHIKHISTGLIRTRFLTAINSGMCIRCSYLKHDFAGYNEQIKFYGTDNDFMYKYSLDNDNAYVLESSMSHMLNYYSEQNLSSKLNRFKDVKNGIYQQMKTINIALLYLSKVYLFIYSMKLNIKFKTTAFTWN